MKNSYPLPQFPRPLSLPFSFSFSLPLPLLLLFSITAQAQVEHRLSIGLETNFALMQTSLESTVYFASSSRSSSGGSSTEWFSAMGVTAAYALQFHDRWEGMVRASYSGNTSMDQIMNRRGYSSLIGNYHFQYEHPRKYRHLWGEFLLFRRIYGEHVLPDVQVGTGITYMTYTQDYMSGYEFDDSIEDFTVKYFTNERKSVIGIPLQVQVQYPLGPKLKVGGNGHINIFMDGSAIVGLNTFLVYRL